MDTCSYCLILLSLFYDYGQSEEKRAYACGTKRNLCRLLFFECLPGKTIEITKAYDVQKDESLQCQKYVRYCTQTYISNCCSEVKGDDSIINFSRSIFHTVKEHCDNKRTCSDLILTHTAGLQVVEYNCKTDKEIGSFIDGSSTENEKDTHSNMNGFNTSRTKQETDHGSNKFSVKSYLSGLVTGLVVIGLPVSVLCIVHVRKRFLKKRLHTSVSRDHPTYVGLAAARLSQIYEELDADDRI